MNAMHSGQKPQKVSRHAVNQYFAKTSQGRLYAPQASESQFRVFMHHRYWVEGEGFVFVLEPFR